VLDSHSHRQQRAAAQSHEAAAHGAAQPACNFRQKRNGSMAPGVNKRKASGRGKGKDGKGSKPPKEPKKAALPKEVRPELMNIIELVECLYPHSIVAPASGMTRCELQEHLGWRKANPISYSQCRPRLLLKVCLLSLTLNSF